MTEPATTGVTRREMLQVGSATFAGYALAADTVLAQVIKTDTDGRPSYNAAAAADAWKRCAAFFERWLKA